MDMTIVPSSLPFRWRGQVFKLGPSGKRNGEPFAEVSPSNGELVEEIKLRIQKDNGLKLYIGFGYTCFIEDYDSGRTEQTAS